MTVPVTTDEAVERFSAVLRQEEFLTELKRRLPSLGQDEPFRDMSLRMLKPHKNRVTFEMGIKTRGGSQSILCKCHLDNRQDVFDAMQVIYNAGFGAGADFAIAKPVAYLSPFNTLLEEMVQGTRSSEVFLGGKPDEQIGAARRCAGWLARFHNFGPQQGKATNPEEFILQLQRWTNMIKQCNASFSEKCDALFHRLEAVAPTLSTLKLCPGHGSYMAGHVFFDGSRTVVIDLDEYDMADPARDLAWFIVYLKRLGLKHKANLNVFDQTVEAFLAAYSDFAGRNPTRHLGFYIAAECVHRARRDVCWRMPPSSEWGQVMLDEGLRSL